MTLLPSAPVAVVYWLSHNTAVSALVADRVGTRLDPVMPAIRVQRIGGTPPLPWRDQPIIQIECWAADEGMAEKVALTVVDQLPSVRSTLASGRIYSYEIESGPYFATDDPNLSTNVRYILTVRLLLTKTTNTT